MNPAASWPFQYGSTTPATPPAGGTPLWRRRRLWWGPNALLFLFSLLER